jgi:hypothetical protein
MLHTSGHFHRAFIARRYRKQEGGGPAAAPSRCQRVTRAVAAGFVQAGLPLERGFAPVRSNPRGCVMRIRARPGR